MSDFYKNKFCDGHRGITKKENIKIDNMNHADHILLFHDDAAILFSQGVRD